MVGTSLPFWRQLPDLFVHFHEKGVDMLIYRYKIAVFVDGEFWHGENWAERKAKLKHNREYWIEKIEENMARDKRVDGQLQEMGWITIRFWEKQVLKHTDECLQVVLELLEKKNGQAL